ncbi:MAG TPA: UvrD-helicase domain-containing protein [Kofleriaceae bacterium]|nr:UvrD-helicase domain-containing protein [Kofleriaceae bacterium]
MDVSHLNPPQREAVTHGAGPLLVLAGAGSGKTRVITHRIAHLVCGGLPARSIAALTFTNKAAGEMRERVAALLPSARDASDLTMGTFHSLGLQLLQLERKALGFPRGFVIYDAADQLGCVREILRRVDAGGRRFDVKAILSRISLAKNAFLSPEEYAASEGDEYDEIAAEVYPRYQRALRAYAAVDFDDLITEPVRLLDTNDEVRERWQSKFRHVLVDEFQDTNRAQMLLVGHLVAQHRNLCVVGDDDQSIYSWRGADPTNILRFDQLYPGALVVKLEQNYRSTPTILAAANAVIANNIARHGKTLWSARSDGPRIVHAVAPDVSEEAKFVAREILRVREEAGRKFGDFAVLYRSNIQTRILEEELRTHHVPYAMFGGQQFYERKEVKDLIAYLRLALNSRDEIALRRVINYPARGIGSTTVQRLVSRAEATHAPMWGALAEVHGMDDVRPATRDAVASFAALVRDLGETLANGAGVVAATRRLMERIDLIGDLRAASPTATAAQRRIDNVEMLLASLERHEARKPGADSLLEYLRQLSLSVSDEAVDEDARDKVTLTTLHGAKGLEFPVVFFIGLEEELIPHARTLNPNATDLSDPEHATDVSEERRLAYVGITRAQDRLYLTRTALRNRHGRLAPRTPSRFLLEIPEDLLEERDIAEELQQPVATDEVANFFASFNFD